MECNRMERSVAGTRRIQGFSKAIYLKLNSVSNTATIKLTKNKINGNY